MIAPSVAEFDEDGTFCTGSEVFVNHTRNGIMETSPIAKNGYLPSGFRQRLSAAVIDWSILAIILAVFFAGVAQVAIFSKSSPWLEPVAFILGLCVLGFPAFYFWVLTWFSGQTIGKRIVGIIVLDDSGHTLGLGRSFLREVVLKWGASLFGLVVPIVYIGFLWIARDRDKKGWHDIIAGASVVQFQDEIPPVERPRKAVDVREIFSQIVIAALVLSVTWFVGGWIVTGFSSLWAPAYTGNDRPVSLSEPLDSQFVQLGEERMGDSKREWQRLLIQADMPARMVPLSEIDPRKDLLIFLPGIGLNFQDAHTIAELDDTYQVVIGIYDRNQPLDRNAELLSRSIEDLAKYRAHLAREAAIEYRGDLRLIGHSLGGLIGTLVLVNLDDQGLIGSGPNSQFFRVNFVNIDAPWRGFDVPWIFTLPGVNHVAHELFPKIPVPDQVTRSALSVINRTRSMDVVLSSRLPHSVEVTLVSVIPLSEELEARRTEPVDGWSSEELTDMQLKRIQQYLASDQRSPNHLDEWAWGRAIRKQDLQQLMTLLEWDADYARYGEDLRNIAGRTSNLEDFRVAYDRVILTMVDTFRGQHTRFMWEDDTFLPWLRAVLNDA